MEISLTSEINTVGRQHQQATKRAKNALKVSVGVTVALNGPITTSCTLTLHLVGSCSIYLKAVPHESKRYKPKEYKKESSQKDGCFLLWHFSLWRSESTNLTPGIGLESGEPRTLPDPLPCRRNTASARGKKLFLNVPKGRKTFCAVNPCFALLALVSYS